MLVSDARLRFSNLTTAAWKKVQWNSQCDRRNPENTAALNDCVILQHLYFHVSSAGIKTNKNVLPLPEHLWERKTVDAGCCRGSWLCTGLLLVWDSDEFYLCCPDAAELSGSAELSACSRFPIHGTLNIFTAVCVSVPVTEHMKCLSSSNVAHKETSGTYRR